MVNGEEEKKSDYVLLRSDRRRNLRSHLLVLNVRGEASNKSFFGYAKVISRGGMFIATVNPREIGEEFMIEFSLPDKTPVRCKCRVVWRRDFLPRALHEPGMGIKFLDMVEEIGNKIDRWVKKG